MGRKPVPLAAVGSDAPHGAALQHGPWRMRANLSSGLEQVERFLARTVLEHAPWAVVGFGCGIAMWFIGRDVWQWLAVIAFGLGTAMTALALLSPGGAFPFIRRAMVTLGFALALGCGLVWVKASAVGAPPITRPFVAQIGATVLSREDQPADKRVRLLLATREPGTDRAIKVRLNVPIEQVRPEIANGAVIRVRARLVPPPPPMLPGGYDFARTAWFAGISATGSAIGPVTILSPGQLGIMDFAQQGLSRHVQDNIAGSPGAIAAALASGDRGGISEADDQAMRDAGLTHLLSVSGLHVSAVIAAAYFVVLRFLALLPWLALRVRLPLVAAGAGAVAGIGYTLLTGAELPTIRSCFGAVLVLLAMAIGRDPLSMRLVAIAASFVLLFWPEALVGPSFQMSFAAVIAIVALHGSLTMRAFNAPRDEGWLAKGLRHIVGLLLTGVVIELSLMPIVLFHFHRAGIYGALANIVAIPLTTFAAMPLIALGLLFDTIGLGAPFWWLGGKALELLLALAHWFSSLPGAVTAMPAIGQGAFALFVAGLLWLALWQSRIRMAGLLLVGLGCVLLVCLRSPDLLVSGDGRHVGITSDNGRDLLVLRESRSGYTRDNLVESAGMNGEVHPIADWPGAVCNPDFCAITLRRGDRQWHLLIGRGTDYVPERSLAAACERADIVIAPRYLPGSCRPLWLKADRRLLDRTGGLTLDLASHEIRTVAQDQGDHGWWQPAEESRSRQSPASPRTEAPALDQ